MFVCFYMELLKIGNLKLRNRLFLAPMVDVTDLPYREICRKAGAGMTYTEMLYIDAILHDNKRTKNLMKVSKGEKPVGIQITGNNEEEFEKFVESKKWNVFDLIDLNCGCPSMRITGNRAGSYLLKNPEKIGRMINILKKTGKPVTVKIRLGYKKNNVLEVARAVEKAGADALTVHARLAVDGRNVCADWKWIEKVKKSVKIPVIGNGDVFFGENARRMLEVCDGVMIARGAIGDPLIFSRIQKYLKTGREPEKDIKKNLKLFEEYMKLQEKYYGKEVDLGRVKYVGGKFLKGFRGAAEVRAEFVKLQNVKEMRRFIKEDVLKKLWKGLNYSTP
jgi:tRNA-dihydrouridine synthase B